MLIYLGTFAASVGIAAYGEHLRTKKNNEKGFYLCLALAVLVMASTRLAPSRAMFCRMAGPVTRR